MATDPTYLAKVHGDGPDKITVESGGTIDILAGGVFALAGTDIRAKLAALPAAADAASQPVQGVAAGYKVARLGASAVTGTLEVTSGLATVVAVAAMLAEDPNADATIVTVVIPTQTGGDAGKFTLKVWKPTAADNSAPTAAVLAKNVSWIAVGT